MKNVKVIKKKLTTYKGKEVDGLADKKNNTIYIDSRTNKKYHLYLLIHEIEHILNWDWPENKVVEHSKKITNMLWKEKYRKCDT